MVEQSPEKACVGGSIPSLATTLNGVVIDSFKILISLSVLSNGVDPTRTPSRKENVAQIRKMKASWQVCIRKKNMPHMYKTFHSKADATRYAQESELKINMAIK